MARSKFFRVAVEGATVDGRTIDAKWLEEMAATFNPVTYGARVNLEHIRGAYPMTGDQDAGAFGSYGDVLSLKTETIDLEIGGKTEKRLALYAEIEALDPLVALVGKGQKLYTSVEINPNFAGSGKAYLVGLAVTDSPASLGTEVLEFSAQNNGILLNHRKQAPGNFFSVADEAQIELIADSQAADPTGLFASFKTLLERFAPPAPPEPKPDESKPVEASGSDLAAFGLAFGQLTATLEKHLTGIDQKLSGLRTDVDKAAGDINAASNPNHHQRPLGLSTTNTVATDC